MLQSEYYIMVVVGEERTNQIIKETLYYNLQSPTDNRHDVSVDKMAGFVKYLCSLYPMGAK